MRVSAQESHAARGRKRKREEMSGAAPVLSDAEIVRFQESVCFPLFPLPINLFSFFYSAQLFFFFCTKHTAPTQTLHTHPRILHTDPHADFHAGPYAKDITQTQH